MDESGDALYSDMKKKSSQAMNLTRTERAPSDASLNLTRTERAPSEVSLASLHGGMSGPRVSLETHGIPKPPPGSLKITPPSVPQIPSTNQLIPKASRKRITDACVDFVIKDLRSFETITGEGFGHLTSALLEIGQSNGTLSVCDLLPPPRTVSESIETRASYVRKKLVPELEHCIKENGAGVTLNFWTDVRNQRNYVGLTVHYFRMNTLVSRVLITTEYEPDLRKDAASVRKWTMDELALFGVTEEVCHSHVIFVTEGNINLVKAFNIPKRPAMKRLACIPHLINSILTTAFDEDNAPESIADVRAMIKESKSLVTHVKHTGLFHEMDVTIKQQCDSMWSPHCDMLESILKQYEVLDELLVRRNEHERMPGPKEVMEELVNFLKLFQDASEELSATTRPTLHMVIPIILQLKQHCDQPSPSGCNAIKATKKRVKELIIEKVEFDTLHKIATFLCPAFRTMKMFNLAEQNIILQEVRRRTTICVFGGIGASASSASDSSVAGGSVKRQKLSAFDFSNFAEPNTLTANVDEIKGYQDFRLIELAPFYQADPIKFWRENAVIFPGLSELARQILCIPASSTPSERLFCRSSFVQNDRLNILKPDKVNDILFLHSNLDEAP